MVWKMRIDNPIYNVDCNPKINAQTPETISRHYVVLAVVHITEHLLCWHWSKYPSSSSLPNAIFWRLWTPVTIMWCSPSTCHHLSRWIKPPSASSVLIVHFPAVTWISHLSFGKWNSGRNISVGLSSDPALWAWSRKVKMQFLKSNP